MERLTVEQEKELLQRVYAQDDFLDNGGGRMVFGCPEDIDIPGVEGDAVVKIALGDAGLCQNEAEVDFYEAHCQDIDLARIYAVGRVCIVMERVDTSLTDYIRDWLDGDLDDEDAAECFAEEGGYTPGQTEELLEQASMLKSDLDDCIGSTSDNGQIGMNEDGCLVAYDYGFDPDYDASEQCSDTREYVDCDLPRQFLLNTILESINEDALCFDKETHAFMAAVEDFFFDNREQWD